MISKREKLLRQIGPHIHNSWAAANILRHVLNSITNGGISVRDPNGNIAIQPRDVVALHRAVINRLIPAEQANHAFEKAASAKVAVPKCTP